MTLSFVLAAQAHPHMHTNFDSSLGTSMHSLPFNASTDNLWACQTRQDQAISSLQLGWLALGTLLVLVLSSVRIARTTTLMYPLTVQEPC